MNDLQRNVRHLCLKIPSAIDAVGNLNVAAAAREIGLSQPVLKRILDGKHDQVRAQTEQKLCSYFGIGKADLYSSVPLDEISDSRIREAIELLNALPEKEHLKATAQLDYFQLLLKNSRR